MQTHSLKARALFLCLTLWLSASAAVYAGGQPEASLSDVQKMITQQDYTDALKALSAIQRKDPNLRDQTDRLIAQVMEVTQRYNAVLEQLNKAIEASDVDSMKTLIAELRRIDPHRAVNLERQSESLVAILKLLNDAELLLRAGKTEEALALYLLPFTQPDKAGSVLPSSQSEASALGEIIASKVKRTVASIVRITQDQIRSAPALAPVIPSVKALVASPSPAGTVSDLAARFDSATAPLLVAAVAEGGVRENAATISEINASIRQASEGGRDNLYLRYVLWLCLGRDNKSEGIAQAIDLLWADSAQEVQQIVDAEIVSEFEAARAVFDSGQLAAADAAFAGFQSRGVLATRATSVLSARFRFNPDTGWRLPDAEVPPMKEALGRALTAQEYSAEVGAYRLLIGFRKDLGAMPSTAFSALSDAPGNLAAETARLETARASLDARTVEARAQEAAWTAREKSWESATGVSDASVSLARSAQRVAGLFRSFADTDLRSRDLAYALRIAAIGGADFPKRLKTAEDLLAKAEGLNMPKADPVDKHPEQALPVLATVKGNLDSLVSDVQSHERKLQADKDYVTSSPELLALFTGTTARPGYTAILQSARADLARVESDALRAQTQADAAASALIEGDKLFQDAENAYASGDLKGATDNLSRSLSAYNRMLDNQYSEHAKARTTKDFLELTARINKANLAAANAAAQKNEAIIRDLINKPDYPAAKERLDAAMASWPADLGPYQPYLDLQQRIQNGLAATQGLTFDRRDPRAEPVNALLASSQANLSASRLKEARQNVVDALSVAPNYGAARVLELKITQATDPVAFKAKADAQIAAYRALAAESSDKDKLYPVYLALLSYSSLDAAYKAQLAPLVQELRYKLGIDPRPATPEQRRQAEDLLARARAQAQQGTEQGYQQALATIARVSAIIPSYPPAVALSQELAAQRVAATPDQLGRAAQQRYNQAWSLYIRGALPDAYSIVKDLWDNPDNRAYAPLQQLKAYLERDLHL